MLIFPDVNYLAVIFAAILNMVIGMLWYSRTLFGKRWMALMKEDERPVGQEMNISRKKAMSWGIMISLVTAYVLAVFLARLGIDTVEGAIKLGTLIWLGFIVLTKANSYLYEQEPLGMVKIGLGYYLVSLVVMAVVIVLM